MPQDSLRAMLEDDPVSEPRSLLRRLAANDEDSVRTVLAPSPISGRPAPQSVLALDRRTRWLVHLAALLVVDASPESLRWATDLACTSGADDGAIVAVLIAAGSVAGAAEVVASAPRLALALGLEPADETGRLTDRADQRPRPAPRPPISMPPRACGTQHGPAF